MFRIPTSACCDVWWVSVSQATQDLSTLEALLAADEAQRAAAFLRPAPRLQFVVARAALRMLLSRYLARSPRTFEFVLGVQGKPSLAQASGLEFNISHAGELVAIAIAGDMPVGIDVESHRADDLESMAAAILAPQDLRAWREAYAAEGSAAFYRIWTCKEAVAKAIGCGMSMDFRNLRIGIAPGDPPRLVALDACWGDARAWCLQELQAAPGYSAALAAAGDALHVTPRRFEFRDWLA